MKRSHQITAFVACIAMLSVLSCVKDDNQQAASPSYKEPTFEPVAITGSATMLPGGSLDNRRPQRASIGGLLTSRSTDRIGAVIITDNLFWQDGSQPGMTINGYADEFIMIPEWLGRRDVFHLGSLIQGNSLGDLSFIPLSERAGHYESKPIFASVSFPAKTVSGSFMPDIMASTEFFSKIMQDNNVQDGQSSTFRYEIKEFNYYDEIKTVFGSNVDVRALFFNSSSTGTSFTGRIQKSNGLIASFTQTNFTVDMDIPEPGELYDNLNMNLLGNVFPAYINSVMYGAKGVLLIESEQDTEVLQTTFNKAFSVMGGLVSGSQSLTADENTIIQNADLQIFFTGINGEHVIRKIGSFEELIALIKTGTTFSAATPGVPIAFKMRSANTHQAIKNDFTITIPFRPFFVKEEFRLDPQLVDAPRHELHLSFFADAKARIPIEIPTGTPIFIERIVGRRREGSPRTGFTMEPILEAKPAYGSQRSHTMVQKPVFLINTLSTPADGSYRKIP